MDLNLQALLEASSDERKCWAFVHPVCGLQMALRGQSSRWCAFSSRDLYYTPGFSPTLNALGFGACEGPTQATPTPRRNPVSLFCGSLNRTITLSIFSWAIVVAPWLQKRVLFSGEHFFFSCPIFPFLLMGFLGSGWGGFWWCKGAPHPKGLLLRGLRLFLGTYQVYEEEPGLQSWRWT